MKYPIKYIEDNLVFNHEGECFAYYELIPYNYSFLSLDEKIVVHENFKQMISQIHSGKIHAIQIGTESSIKTIANKSKELIKGNLKPVAIDKVNSQTEALISMIGDNQVDYRFFIGFKLVLNEQELNVKNLGEELSSSFKNFIYDVNSKLMGDFVSISESELKRFNKMEKLLESKISRRFKIRRVNKNDFGYLLEHIHGSKNTPYEDYTFSLPIQLDSGKHLIKKYDLLRPTRCLIDERQKYVRFETENSVKYVAYFSINNIVDELDFPSSELFYYQQQQFSFPIDTSMNIEIVDNKKALSTVRNKKKELKDLDNHAYESNNDTTNSVIEALENVNDLESELDQSKDSMFKLSYVIRVSAESKEELKRRT